MNLRRLSYCMALCAIMLLAHAPALAGNPETQAIFAGTLLVDGVIPSTANSTPVLQLLDKNMALVRTATYNPANGTFGVSAFNSDGLADSDRVYFRMIWGGDTTLLRSTPSVVKFVGTELPSPPDPTDVALYYNHPPASFVRVSPQDGTTDSISTLEDSLVFTWTRSSDQANLALAYILAVTVNGTTVAVATSDTQYVVHFPQLQINVPSGTFPVVWGVAVTDGDDTVSASNDPGAFSLWILIEGVPIRKNGIPKAFALAQNFPNPFNPTTAISYDIPRSAEVQMEVYNALGMKVRSLYEGHEAAGSYQVSWDGRSDEGRALSSGVYFYRITASAQGSLFTSTKKMLLMK